MKIPDHIDLSSEELLLAAIDGSTSIITILALDGHIIYANRVVEGLELDKFIGSNVFQWLPPVNANNLNKTIASICESKKPILYENTFVTPSGESHNFKNIVRPLIVDNIVISLVIISEEVTKLNLLKQDLLNTNDINKLALDSIGMGVWDWDLRSDDAVLDKALCEMFGLDNDKFEGKNETIINEILHPEDIARFRHENAYAMENGGSYIGEIRFIRKNDKVVRWGAFRSKFIRDEKGDIIRLLAVGWDITEEKEKEEAVLRSTELERQNTELKQFAYLASHDLKAPLRTLKSYTDLLSARYGGKLDDKANQFLEFISGAVDQLDGEIKALLDYSLIGEHQSSESIDVERLIKSIKLNLVIDISKFGCVIEAPNMPTIFGYRSEIYSLFQNLLSNAVKFGSDKRDCQINIKAIEEEEFWHFDIADNGIGIKEENLSKIFTLFERLHNKDDYEGTGIGLAHCRKIVEAHHGKIWATSKYGEGTTFSFTIKKEVLEPVIN